MTRARDIANNWAADITGVTAGTGITGGGTSGTVTVTNSMATTIDAKGDLVVGSGADAFVRVPIGSNDQVLTADSATTSGVKWAALPPSGPEMVTAKVSAGSPGGTYTFTKTFAAGQWQVMQNLAGTTTLASQSLTTANDIRSVNVSSSTSSATINVQPVASWENLDGTIAGNTTATNENFSVANNFLYATGDILARTSDATTWTTASVTSPSTPVLFYNGTYVVGAYQSSYGRIYSSTDGTNWTQRVSQFAGLAGYPPYSGAVAPNATNKFLMGGNGGYLYRSTDGVNWTNLSNTAMGSQRANSITSNGNSLYVVVGDGGKIITSTDGASFTTRTSNTSNNLACVAFGNNLFVAVGENGTVRTSSDGTTWTTVNGLSGQLNEVFYAAGQTYPWVILLQTGNIYYSTDGSTWLGPISTASNNASNYYTGIYFNGKYRIGGGTNTTTGLNQYKASSSVLGVTTSDYYSTFLGPSAITTVN
jgi:hypothetical protein